MVCDGADGQNWPVTDGFLWRAVVQVQAATPSARPMPSNEIRQLTQWFWRLAIPTRTAHVLEEIHEWSPRENPVQTRNVSRANPASIVLLSHGRLHSLRAFAGGFESGADCRTQSKIRKITIAVVSILISAT